MQRLLFFLLIAMIIITGCMPPPLAVVPPETLAVQTMDAMPKTDTPLPSSTAISTATPPPPGGLPTPGLDLSIPGAYCLPVDAPRSQGLVTRVISADTIEILITNQTFSVHLIGVDAPSALAPAEWQGAQSMSYVQNMVEGKVVSLVQDQTELNYQGFQPRYMLVDKNFLNYELIRQGFGQVQENPPDTKCMNSLISAQVEAQTNVRGIWSATPIPTATITPTPTITRIPTRTLVPVCDCLGSRMTCKNFRSQSKAQQCYEYCRSMGYEDIFGLDKNGNGIACEGSSSISPFCQSSPGYN